MLFVSTILAVLIPALDAAIAQERPIIIASSPSPVGSGARATAIGSAFIAVADDATAASWNPAGLIQLEKPEISVVGSFYHQTEHFGSVPRPDGIYYIESGENSSNSIDLNFISGTYPFEIFDRNVVISASYYKKFDFNKDVDLYDTETYEEEGEDPIRFRNFYEFEQSGGLAIVSPALAAQVTPGLSIGVAVNFWMKEFYNDNAWEVRTRTKGYREIDGEVGGSYESGQNIRFVDFSGTNATFGLLWNVYRGLSIGGFYELGFTARVNQEWQLFGTSGTQDYFFRLKMDMPPSYGFGLSYRFTDSFMITADLTRVEWGKFALEDEFGNKRNLMGKPPGEDDPDTTNTVRIGAEYFWFFDRFVVPIRAGGFYDPQPSSGSPTDYFGFACGSGIILKSVQIDFAYQLRIGKGDEQSNLLDILGEDVFVGAELDSYQHLFMLSVVYRFG